MNEYLWLYHRIYGWRHLSLLQHGSPVTAGGHTVEDLLNLGWSTEGPAHVCEWCSCVSDHPHTLYHSLCVNCGDSAIRCAHCSAVTYEDESWYLESTDQRVCDDCYSQYEEEERRRQAEGCLYEYSYKPYPMFYTTNGVFNEGQFHADPLARTAPFMGLELEMESRGASIADAVLEIQSNLGAIVYCKHDGSLDDGLEMVTHPFLLEYMQRTDLSVLTRLKRRGWRSWNTDTCGMHVHVNRGTFTGQAHLYRFAQLVYKNESTCKAFAGRESSYASFYDGHTPGYIAKVVKGQQFSSRGAVNMQNSDTVEVRIFKGSLKPQRVLANLEFVHSAVEYTRTLTVREAVRGGLTWRAFATWILDNRSTLPNLYEYLDLNPTAPNNTHDPEYATY